MDDNQVVINAAEIEAWHLRDVTARNYIFATLTKAMKQNLYSCKTAAAMWTRLDTQYQLRAAENLHLLWQSFYDFTHHVGTLTQCKMIIPRLYLTSSLSLDDDMTSHIQKLTSEDLREPVCGEDVVLSSLMTLSPSFVVVSAASFGVSEGSGPANPSLIYLF
jgi:hypothetical protein